MGTTKIRLDIEIMCANRKLQPNYMPIAGSKSGFIQVGPDKWFFPIEYKNEAKKIYNFEVRPSDVWIVTYPRSGKIFEYVTFVYHIF